MPRRVAWAAERQNNFKKKSLDLKDLEDSLIEFLFVEDLPEAVT